MSGNEVRILTPVGMMGYGFPEEHVRTGMERRPHAIVVDGGSTDPGPYQLGLGRMLAPMRAYERELRTLLGLALPARVPLVISSAGGPGLMVHAEEIAHAAARIAGELGRAPRIAVVGADMSPVAVRAALDTGDLASCDGAPEATAERVEASAHIVAQMGHEPFLRALREGADIVIAGRAYDPAPAVAVCLHHMPEIDAGAAWHMGKIIECGAVCAEPKGHAILATVRRDAFELEPLDPDARCTPLSVAAHAFYEKGDALTHHGPDGTLHLADARYEALDGRRVRVSGARWEAAQGPVRIKIEGAGPVGHRAIFVGGVRDPVFAQILPHMEPRLRDYLARIHPEYAAGEVDVRFHLYGLNAVMGPAEPVKVPGHEVGVLCEVTAATQELADDVCATARVAVLHAPYPGQKATGGNLALPLNPPEQAVGPVCAFHLYHTMPAAPDVPVRFLEDA